MRLLKYNLYIVVLLIGVVVYPQQTVKSSDSTLYYLKRTKVYLQQDISVALDHLGQAEKFQQNYPDPTHQATLEFYYGTAYYIKGNYKKSLNYYLKAEKGFREVNDKLNLAKAYNGIGLIQQAIDRHKEAIVYFKKAINTSPANSSVKAAFLLNMGISQIELKNYETASEYINKAHGLAKDMNYQKVLHPILNRKAQLLYLKNNFTEAKLAYNNILKDHDHLNTWEKSFAYAGLAEVYLDENLLEEAENTAFKSLNYAKKINSFWDIHRSTHLLAEIYTVMGDSVKYNFYSSLEKQYQDSLYNRANLSDINLLQLKHQEQQNEILANEKKKSEDTLLIIKILFLLVVIKTILAILILIKLKKANKQKSELNARLVASNEQLRAINQGKNKMFSILSHDLRSPIASMLQLTELLKEDAFSKEEQKEVLGEMHLQLTSTSLMLQNLLKWASSQMENNEVNIVKLNLVEKVKGVVDIYHIIAKNKNISLLHEILHDEIFIKADEAHLNVILHNLVSNAIKYTPAQEEVKISYSINEHTCLNVFNAGEPISKEKIEEIENKDARLASEKGTLNEYGTGLGLLLVKQYLRPNQAKLTITPIKEKGTEFRICFKRLN